MISKIVSSIYKPYIPINSNINIWDFKTAPIELKSLSDNGGDEDWIAMCSKDFYDSKPYIPFLESGLSVSIGVCDVQKILIEIENEYYLVFIGCHS